MNSNETVNNVKNENPNQVKSVMKAFALIEALNEGGPLSIGELSQQLSMDKATVHRLVNTIKTAGYMTQNMETKKYSNSIKLFEIGQNVITKIGLLDIARPFMDQLAVSSGESVNLGIFRDNKIIYIDKKEGKSAIRVSTKIGTSIPLHCTGMGKAVLAHIKGKQLEDILNTTEYKKYAINSPRDRETVLQSLKKCLEQGYSQDDEEYMDDIISFGAPVFNYKGDPIAAISISCPKARYKEQGQGELFPLLVKNAAELISKKIGYIL